MKEEKGSVRKEEEGKERMKSATERVVREGGKKGG